MDKFDFKLKKSIKVKNIFEGYYFKQTSNDFSCSFIPGFSTNKKDPHSFIQVITPNKSYYFRFKLEEFSFSKNEIKIANNIFSLDKIYLKLVNEEVLIKAELHFTNLTPLISNLYDKTIMGPFSYLPFMECIHGICSMKHNVNGFIKINNKNFDFNDDLGYIEKDVGSSFPKEYIWLEGNNKESSFFFSCATIPISFFNFEGVICVLKTNDFEKRFATYHGVKIKKIINKNDITVVLNQKKEQLVIKFKNCNGHSLKSPLKGEMKNCIKEELRSKIMVKYYKDSKLIYSDFYKNGSIEINN